MLPNDHFLIAGLVIMPVTIILFPEKSAAEIGRYVLAGGLLSAAVDLDICVLVWLKAKKENQLKPFRNPLEIYRNFNAFMKVITETGVLRTGLKTHLLLSAFVVFMVYFFWNAYLVPVTLGIVTHLLSDIPNIRRLINN